MLALIDELLGLYNTKKEGKEYKYVTYGLEKQFQF